MVAALCMKVSVLREEAKYLPLPGGVGFKPWLSSPTSRKVSNLKEAKLKLNQSKCYLFQRSIKYLGHIVSEEGVNMDPDKIASVKSWPVPSKVWRYSIVGYYRRFRKGISKVTQPLHELTRGSAEVGNIKRKIKRVKTQEFCWGPQQQQAFEELKEKCTEAPVLAFADYSKPFIVHTEASVQGLGAVRDQEIK